MTYLATLQNRLGEAENAYHLLMTGGKKVSVNIGVIALSLIRQRCTQAGKIHCPFEAGNQRQTGRFGCKAIYVEF